MECIYIFSTLPPKTVIEPLFLVSWVRTGGTGGFLLHPVSISQKRKKKKKGERERSLLPHNLRLPEGLSIDLLKQACPDGRRAGNGWSPVFDAYLSEPGMDLGFSGDSIRKNLPSRAPWHHPHPTPQAAPGREREVLLGRGGGQEQGPMTAFGGSLFSTVEDSSSL